MLILDTISRIVHVSTAIVLVGGSAFTLMVLLPSAKQLSEEAHQQLAAAINGRWKKFVHGGIALFLLSGFYNYMQAMPLHKGDGPWHMLMGIKMLLAFVIFFLASALVGRSQKMAGMRANKGKWLTVIVVLAAIVVSLSGYLKVRGPVAKPAAALGQPAGVLGQPI